jgi:PEP-CTERM motif
MKTRTLWSLAGALALLIAPLSRGQVTVTFFGDDDGFGVGETAGNLTAATTSHQGAGEAQFTDLRLIGDGFGASLPAFAPAGSFAAFSLPAGSTITQAVLTLRTGSFDSGPSPVDGPNSIFLDGLLVYSAFIDGFSQVAGEQIETRSFVLNASFFPIFADGLVSLNGTHLSEDGGSGSFQVDFLKLEITTSPGVTPVPEPSTYGLLGAAGLVGLVALRRRRAQQVQ